MTVLNQVWLLSETSASIAWSQKAAADVRPGSTRRFPLRSDQDRDVHGSFK
jgi:hypothetical protein